MGKSIPWWISPFLEHCSGIRDISNYPMIFCDLGRKTSSESKSSSTGCRAGHHFLQVWHLYWLALTCTNTYTDWHWLAFTSTEFIWLYWLALIGTNWYWLTLTISDLNLPAATGTDASWQCNCHLLALVLTGTHWQWHWHWLALTGTDWHRHKHYLELELTLTGIDIDWH